MQWSLYSSTIFFTRYILVFYSYPHQPPPHQTKQQTLYYHTRGDGSLILLFALILTFCQAQQGNMAGGDRFHGYGAGDGDEVARGRGWGKLENQLAGVLDFSVPTLFLIEVLLHVGSNVLDGQHGLFARGLDLRLGQQEAVTTGVTQLKGEGVFYTQVVGPVVGASGSGV